jgi:heat shock protein HspQ
MSMTAQQLIAAFEVGELVRHLGFNPLTATAAGAGKHYAAPPEHPHKTAGNWPFVRAHKFYHI